MADEEAIATAGSDDAVVSCHGLSKHYGDLVALQPCDLAVKQGDVFGLLGPNGAGKTTLLRLLMGYLRPTAGAARIMTFDCYRQAVDVHRLVAYLPGEPRLFRRMRGSDVIDFFARIRPGSDRQRARKLADCLQLDVSRRVAHMSTGMKQKLALVITFAADTPLIILDEPTSNLDPNVRRTISQMVLDARNEGRTILLSSHVLPEVESVCNRVAILRAGLVVHEQLMAELRKRHRLVSSSRLTGLTVPQSLADRVRLLSTDPVTMELDGDLGDLLAWLAGLALRDVTFQPLGLQTIYDQFHQSGSDHLSVGRSVSSSQDAAGIA